MRICITSDWHLDARTNGFSRWDDIVQAVETSLVSAYSASLYVMLGDLCDPDTRACWRASAYAVEVAARLQLRGVESLWIAGNHDVAEDGAGSTTLSPLERSGVGHVAEKPRTFEHRGLLIVCLPFAAPECAYDPEQVVREFAQRTRSDGKTRPDLVVGHLNIEGAVPGSETHDLPRGREVYWPIDAIQEVWPGVPMIGGHYHRRGDIRGVRIVGSLVRLSHGEEDNDPALMVLDV